MSYEGLVRNKLVADATLMALLTGGLYAYEGLSGEGITRKTLAGAYSTGFLAPCGVVKGRALIPFGGVRDQESQYTSVRQVIEIWLYADAGAGLTTLTSAANRIYKVLEGQTVTNSHPLRWLSQESFVERELQQARAILIEFEVIGYRS